jgi:uncharacterized spore protein YtfJ
VQAQELLKRVGQNLSVHRAFGTAYEKDGILIIPVALVAGGGGGGEAPVMTSSGLVDPDAGSREVDSDAAHETPTGSGAGFGGMVMPAGVYVVRGDDVRWKPALNVTLIALSSLSVIRLLLRLRARVILRQKTSA